MAAFNLGPGGRFSYLLYQPKNWNNTDKINSSYLYFGLFTNYFFISSTFTTNSNLYISMMGIEKKDYRSATNFFFLWKYLTKWLFSLSSIAWFEEQKMWREQQLVVGDATPIKQCTMGKMINTLRPCSKMRVICLMTTNYGEFKMKYNDYIFNNVYFS